MVLQFVHYSVEENNSPVQLVQMKTFAAWLLFLTLELSFVQYNSCYFLSLEIFVNFMSLITIYSALCVDDQTFVAYIMSNFMRVWHLCIAVQHIHIWFWMSVWYEWPWLHRSASCWTSVDYTVVCDMHQQQKNGTLRFIRLFYNEWFFN